MLLLTLGWALALAGPSDTVVAGVEAYEGNDYEGAVARLDDALARAEKLKPLELSTAYLYRARARLALSSGDKASEHRLLLGAAEDAKAAEDGDPGAIAAPLGALQDELAVALYELGRGLVRTNRQKEALPALTASVGLVPSLESEVLLCSTAGKLEAHDIAIAACSACLDQALQTVAAAEFAYPQCASPAVSAYLYGRSPAEPDNAVRAVEKGRKVLALQEKRLEEGKPLMSHTDYLNSQVSAERAAAQLDRLERIAKAYHPTRWAEVAESLASSGRREDYGLLLVVAGRAHDANDLARAIPLFEKAMALDPGRYEAPFNLGVVYVNSASMAGDNVAVMAQLKKGLALLQTAHKLNPRAGAIGPIRQVCTALQDQACLAEYR